MATFFQIDLPLTELEDSRFLQRDLEALLCRTGYTLWDKYGQSRVYTLLENAPVALRLLKKDNFCSEEFLGHVRSITLGHPPLDHKHYDREGASTGGGCIHEYCMIRGDNQHLYFFATGTPVKLPPQLREQDAIPESRNPEYSNSLFMKLLHRVDITRPGTAFQRLNMKSGEWEDNVYESGHHERFDYWRPDAMQWLCYPKVMTTLHLWLRNPLGLAFKRLQGLWLYNVWYKIFPGAHPLRRLLKL
jgi:hypothetical protein